ncbi:MAG: hypothetical protein GQ559_00170 [Desulfobulbaceae bacterium]|nr:hypothetical protein [Desulfobulbaceae bacterium]
MNAPEKITAPVERLHDNGDAYGVVNYNETQVRRDFIDPQFEELESEKKQTITRQLSFFRQDEFADIPKIFYPCRQHNLQKIHAFSDY